MALLSPSKGFLCRFNTTFLPDLYGKRKQAKCILFADDAVSAKPVSEAIFALPPHMPFVSYYFPLLPVYNSILSLN